MMRRSLLLGGLLVIFLSSLAVADPGMWLFEAFPSAKVKAKYGFGPTAQWLEHVRLSSVRFNNGGSGSFVSADGLTFTNHHIASECIQQLSTAGKDYMKAGFYARTQAEELKCPAYELNQLVGIEDVTAQVKGVVKTGMSAAEAGQAERAEMSRIEEQCTKKSGLRCDVVTLYSGEMYHLYQYKKYTDVRLVFAPEFDAAFFGGDPDNFEYPRYDLDISFFRVYENGKPVHLDNYFRWSPSGVTDKELIFVSGNPGSTGRLLTMAQLEFLRDVDYPTRLEYYKERIAMLQKFSAESPDNARIAQEDLFTYQNSLKAVNGYLSGLQDQQLMAQKAGDEAKFKAFVEADSRRKAEFDDPWAALAKSMEVQRRIYLPLAYVERMRGFSGSLAMYARDLVRGAQQRRKPNPERLREFRESALPSLEADLFSTAPVYKNLEIASLADSFALMARKLGSDNPAVKAALSDKTPEEAARYLVENTRLQDVAVRQELWSGGESAIQGSTDPLIALMRQVEPEALAVRKTYEDQVESVARRDGALLAKARFAMGGLNEPPDAGFTLRLSYGEVEGYTFAGKHYPYFTTMGGAYQHAAAHGNKPPYQLPESWMTHQTQVKPATPLNFVNTADIIGGNSGSPTLNRRAEVVGIIFDGNIQSLPWNFVYSDKVGRSISVDSRGIMEALRDIYGADRVVRELESGREAR
ncbi:MAG TPA: S46 family peptidase [Terriglobales bacterium]|nr:S46 family peptidase [Terriglobales bacterium]